jgi:hypothetical protein
MHELTMTALAAALLDEAGGLQSANHFTPGHRSIRGANHFLYSDDRSVLASHLVLGTLRLFRVLKIDGRRQLAITTHCVYTFLDARLKQASASPLNLSLYCQIYLTTQRRRGATVPTVEGVPAISN